MEAVLLALRRIFPTVLRMSLSAGVLALVVLALRLALGKAPKWVRCLLWALVAVRLLCPILPESRVSLMPRSTLPDTVYTTPPAVEFETPQAPAVSPPEGETDAPVSREASLRQSLPILWAAGVLAMLLYAAASYLRLRRRVRVNVPLDERVLLCDEIDTPFILGVLRPRIFLPSGLAEPQRAHVLAHERAHLARRDHWWKPLGFVLLAVHWFNPVLWLAYILLCRDVELACDERVVRGLDREGVAGYSQALLACGAARARIAACPLAFGEVGVKQRVKNVLNYKKPAFWIVCAAILALAAAGICFLTDSPRLSEPLRAAMDAALTDPARFPYSDGHFIAADYDVLRVERSGSQTAVYAWVCCEEFSHNGYGIQLESGSNGPRVLTFASPGGQNYTLVEDWTPGDGSEYAPSIRERFPLLLWGRVFGKSGADGQQHSENCKRKAREYYAAREAGTDMEHLRVEFPDYFDLPTDKGLAVYFWQMAQGPGSFALLPDKGRTRDTTELMKLKGATLSELRAILSTYDISSDDITVIPWTNPISSYYNPLDERFAESLGEFLVDRRRNLLEYYSGDVSVTKDDPMDKIAEIIQALDDGFQIGDYQANLYYHDYEKDFATADFTRMVGGIETNSQYSASIISGKIVCIMDNTKDISEKEMDRLNALVDRLGIARQTEEERTVPVQNGERPTGPKELTEALRLALEQTSAIPRAKPIQQRYSYYYEAESRTASILVFTDYAFDDTGATDVDVYSYSLD